jgi:hypothetical protein
MSPGLVLLNNTLLVGLFWGPPPVVFLLGRVIKVPLHGGTAERRQAAHMTCDPVLPP